MADVSKSAQPSDDHAWVHDHLATSIASGLSAEEQARFDAHINACPECFDAFTEARDADRALQRALGPLAPSSQFEQNLLETLREKTMHKRFAPLIKRAGFALAASVALAATGVFAQYAMRQDTVTRALADRQLAAARSHGMIVPFVDGRPEITTPVVRTDPTDAAAGMRGIIQSQAVYSNESADSYALARDVVSVLKSKVAPTGMREMARSVQNHLGFADGLTESKSQTDLGDGNDNLLGKKLSGSPGPVTKPLGPSTGGAVALDGGTITYSGASSHQWGYGLPASRVIDTNGNSKEFKLDSENLGDARVAAASGTTIAGTALGSGEVLNYDGPNVTNGTLAGNLAFNFSRSYGVTTPAGPDYFRPRFQEAAGKGDNGRGSFEDHLSTSDAGDWAFEDATKQSKSSSALPPVKDKEAAELAKPSSAPFATALVPSADVGTGTRDGDEAQKQRPAAEVPLGHLQEPNAPAAATPPALMPPPASGEPDVSVAQRKIIRNGTVEFEVVSFDDTSTKVSAIVTEEGGFVSATSSDRLTNGKIKGTIVVRVPPEHLDRFLLKIRALGDLKTQQIAANDVTKEYTDVESELRGLRTMEARMIDLIKNGKGEVKDLVAAEKQLGEYRVRIEKLEGDIRYYNNLVGMATLSIVAYEKDIQKPTAASEMENVSLSLETEDVETKYKDARKILEDAKGRIVESELKKYDADQYSARIVVDVPPDKADFVTGQLKQIGKVASYNRDRKQTATGGTGVPTVAVEEKDTRLVISLYNLANVAPRETAVLTIAVRDVEATYRKVLDLVRGPAAIQLKEGEPINHNFVPAQAPGRVITSNISGQQPQQMSADIRADVRSEDAQRVLEAIRGSGEILASTLSENPDTANTTLAKRGIQLRLVNVASVPARETRTLRVVAASVSDAYARLISALQDPGGAGAGGEGAGIRIISSQLNETDPRTVSAKLSFEARREALPAVDRAFAAAGIDFLSRNIVRSNDTANTLDSKVYFQIDELLAADALAPRRTTVLGVELKDVEKSLDSLRAALPPGAREIEYNLTKEANGRITGHLVLEAPITNAMALLTRIKDLGGVEKVNQVVKNTQVPDAPFARERIDLTLTSQEALVESGKGFSATIRAALGSAATALLLSLYLVLTGLLFAGPFVLIIWAGYRLFFRRRRVAV